MQHPVAIGLPLLLALLAGCAAQAPQLPVERDWQQHRTRLAQLEQWTATGKLALRSSGQSESASILWRQQGVHTHLHLSGPVGIKATSITSDGKQMEMRQGEHVTTWDISTPGEIARSTGWDLPLQALPYWLKGLPYPAMKVQTLELAPDTALLQRLKQDDWEVLYEAYQLFDDLSLPTRLRISRGDTSARMIIRDWSTPSA